MECRSGAVDTPQPGSSSGWLDLPLVYILGWDSHRHSWQIEELICYFLSRRLDFKELTHFFRIYHRDNHVFKDSIDVIEIIMLDCSLIVS